MTYYGFAHRIDKILKTNYGDAPCIDKILKIKYGFALCALLRQAVSKNIIWICTSH